MFALSRSAGCLLGLGTNQGRSPANGGWASGSPATPEGAIQHRLPLGCCGRTKAHLPICGQSVDRIQRSTWTVAGVELPKLRCFPRVVQRIRPTGVGRRPCWCGGGQSPR